MKQGAVGGVGGEGWGEESDFWGGQDGMMGSDEDGRVVGGGLEAELFQWLGEKKKAKGSKILFEIKQNQMVCVL